MRSRLAVALTVALAGLAVPSLARADLPPPPEQTVCRTKKQGDACEVDGVDGACAAHTCSKRHYADGKLTSRSVPCLRCEVGVKPKAAAVAAEDPPAEPRPDAPVAPEPADPPPTDEAAPKPEDAAAVVEVKEVEAVKEVPAPAPPGPAAESQSSCAVDPAVGGAPLLLVLAAARRRRR